MRSEELDARKVKAVLSVAALWSQCLSPHCTPLWVAGVTIWAVVYMNAALSSARPMCFPWLSFFCCIQRTALLGLLSLSVSLHVCSYLISQLLLSGVLRETLFSQASLSFLFMKKFHDLISLNPPNYFPFLWLRPPSVPSGNIFQN